MIRPTARTLLLAGALLPAAIAPTLAGAQHWPIWLGAVAVLVAVLLAEFALLPWAGGVAIAAEPPTVIHVGTSEPLRVAATSRRSVRIALLTEVNGEVESPPPARIDVAPGAQTTVEIPLRPLRRGTIGVVALHLRWRGPLGLLWRETEIRVDATIKVIPDVRSVRAEALRLVSRREFQVGLKIERYVGDGSEFDSLREFVAGMDRRAIDWKASARHLQVLSREFRAERNHQVVLCVDAGRLMGEPIAGMPRLDHAIHAALQLGYVCLRTGDRVGLFTFADRGIAHVTPQSGVHALHVVQDRLAELDYTTVETNYTRSVTELLSRLRRRSLVVLFTEFADSIGAELMLPNVQSLARRHLLLFVALRDPLVAQLADGAPASTLDLHRAVVAHEIAQERELVLERIRSAGAQVVDAEAAQIGARLIDRYLQVKRRELV